MDGYFQVDNPGHVFKILSGQLYASNETLSEYCVRGTRIVKDWSCDKRVAALLRREGRVSEDPVVEALKRCCLAVSEDAGLSSSGGPPLSILEINFKNPSERSYFPESWMYQEKDIYMG